MAMKKILIVDDAAFMRTAVEAMLSGSYETVSAASVEEAAALFEKLQPDLVLTDLVMPGQSGLDLQRLLRQRYGDDIPIIFMSADEDEENEIRSLESGAMDFIRKPFKKEVLLRRVGNLMRRMEEIERLRMVAETDPMTGLLNKAHAQQVLRNLCTRATGTLMMVDLDSFKLVNDLYGHAMGDQVLIRFAEILRGAIRATDIAGRMGGDEFIAFCQDVRDEGILQDKTRRINEQILSAARELMGEDMNIPLGASVGAVLVPEEGTNFSDLYAKADKALYEVKRNGKHGCAVYHGTAAKQEVSTPYSATLTGAKKILGERNRPKGAYEVGFEQFQCIYRFLARCIEIYHHPVDFAIFSLTAPDCPEETIALFGEMLGRSLRRSDVFTRSGKNQYLVLLPETVGENAALVLRRIANNWKSGGGGEIAFESAPLEV